MKKIIKLNILAPYRNPIRYYRLIYNNCDKFMAIMLYLMMYVIIPTHIGINAVLMYDIIVNFGINEVSMYDIIQVIINIVLVMGLSIVSCFTMTYQNKRMLSKEYISWMTSIGLVDTLMVAMVATQDQYQWNELWFLRAKLKNVNINTE